MEGTSKISSPSWNVYPGPPRKRISSSFTYTLRKRRISPASSRRCGLSCGNFSSRTEKSSPRLVAEQSSLPTPSVCRRNAVGICTVIDISGLHRFRNIERALKIAFEFRQLGSDSRLGFILAGERVGRLQAVACDAQHGRFVG